MVLYITRDEWGARAPAYPVQVVQQKFYSCGHHSAGPNKAWTFNEMCAHMRSIQNYHIVAMDGADIYYGMVIFPDGTVFEGRYGGWLVNNGGAYGACKVAFGYCFIGTYNEVMPAEPMVMVAKSNMLEIHNRLNIPWNNALGHRDMWFLDIRNKGNDCPGHMTYNHVLPEIREYIRNGGGPQMVTIGSIKAIDRGDYLEAYGSLNTPGAAGQDAFFKVGFSGFTRKPDVILATWASGKNKWVYGPVKSDESKDGAVFFIKDAGNYKLAPGAIDVYARQNK